MDTIADSAQYAPRSVGIDTWGLDFGLLDRNGALLQWPVSYRDRRTEGVMEEIQRQLGKDTIYRSTGVQFLRGNTIYQLAALAKRQPALLERAQTLLMMPDLLFYRLTRDACTEFTIASTTQLVNCTSRNWEFALIDALKLPQRIFTTIVSHGYTQCLSAKLAEQLQIQPLPIIKVASHDTASAVISVPAKEKAFAYISSGTWSVIGTELPAPIIDCASADWSNEAGQGGTVRYCKSLMGMWIFEECRRQLSELGGMSYDELLQLAETQMPFRSLIDPEYPAFAVPCNMAEEIRSYCRRTNQTIPETAGQLVRCIFESTALNYACAFERLCHNTASDYSRLYIVGGGARNAMLGQMTANAIGREVVAGPSEATAFGNFFAQLQASGQIADIAQYRQMLSSSEMVLAHYQPAETAFWRSGRERFMEMRQQFKRGESHYEKTHQ